MTEREMEYKLTLTTLTLIITAGDNRDKEEPVVDKVLKPTHNLFMMMNMSNQPNQMVTAVIINQTTNSKIIKTTTYNSPTI